MNQLLQSSLASFQQDLLIKCEVFVTVHDLVDVVESHALSNKLAKTHARLTSSEELNHALIERIRLMEKHYDTTKQELFHVRREAKAVRERFVNDIGYFLSENQLNQKLKEKILNLEETIANMPTIIEREESVNDKKSPESEKQNMKVDEKQSGIIAAPKENPVIKLLTIPEPILLNMFSFLQTHEVLNYGQVSKFVYQRIYQIFGIESVVVQAYWKNLPSYYPFPSDKRGVALLLGKDLDEGNKPVPATTPSPTTSTTSSTTPTPPTPASLSNTNANANNPNEPRLTREMVDSLTKRLQPQEMKVILGLADKLKKQMQLQESLIIEKDDLQAKLQNTESIKDFLIEKLKTAEVAIKSMMQELNTVKKQSISDQEIITYLDLHSQETDSKLQEMTYRCAQLQTSLELQLHTLSLKEEQLAQELFETKTKYDSMDQQSKSQKKALVKEIKMLRQQVDKFVEEKQSTQKKMRLLQQAFNS